MRRYLLVAAWAVGLWGLGCSEGQPPADIDTGVGPVDTGFPPEDTTPPMDTGPLECPAGRTLCGTRCADLNSDNGNCGRCENPCMGGQVCMAGMCAADMMCPGSQTFCAGRCTDTVSDGMNCGACGTVCDPGQTCVGGACRAGMMCPEGQTDCGGMCVSTMTDPAHCGRCGNACGMGETCAAGACMAGMACPMGQTSCGGACTDTATDLNNCGGCGAVCSSGQRCAAGRCTEVTCPMGQTNCGGTCVTTATDVMHCGGCGMACAPMQTCAGGMCMGMSTMCPLGQTRCGDACAALMTDPANCGRCGNACPMGQTCMAGTCMAAMMGCPTGQTDCGGRCVNTSTDRTNCGGCGNACPTGTTCAMGMCLCPTGQTLCGRSCVNTMTSASHCGGCGMLCPAGQTCMSGVCRATTMCPTGQTDCGGSCVNTGTDRAHCGGCGRLCPAGQTCAAGRCGCAAPAMLCGTACVDVTDDRANCGRCGNVCPTGQSCVLSRCGCPTGQLLCGTRCADTATDAANCGRCGNACPTGQSCVTGACRGGTAPGNDGRAGATMIDLSRPAVDLAADTRAARNDTTGPSECSCTGGNDVFYRFTLTQPEVVYADTVGATWDTSLFLQNATGMNLTDAGTAGGAVCNDDHGVGGCETDRQSMIVARLPAGMYFLVLSGCGSGTATIHFQHLPAGSGSATGVRPTPALQTASGTTMGTGSIAAPGCCSGGPENAYWWLSCPGTAAAGQFYATTCGMAMYDTELEQRSALRTTPASVCNDDVGSAFPCGLGSAMTSAIPAGVGLHTFYVDSCSASGGMYRVSYAVGSCATGQTFCGVCVDTATSAAHCGGCNRACAAGQTCMAGACVASAPGNDTRAGATVLSLTSPASTLRADTTAATNHTAGSCLCSSGRDVFFRFTLAAEEIVYADTVGTSWDTALFFQTSAGANIPDPGLSNGSTCNDDHGLTGCETNTQSQVVARLAAGTYYLVLSGCGAGAATIRFQHLPTGSGRVSLLARGTSTPVGLTLGTSGRVTGSCCSGGPEDTFWWYTCPGVVAGAFSAQTCGRATWDTALHQHSPGRATVGICNDDACGPTGRAYQSNLSTTIPAGPGLHALYVDGCNSSVSGNSPSGLYTVSITRP